MILLYYNNVTVLLLQLVITSHISQDSSRSDEIYSQFGRRGFQSEPKNSQILMSSGVFQNRKPTNGTYRLATSRSYCV